MAEIQEEPGDIITIPSSYAPAGVLYASKCGCGWKGLFFSVRSKAVESGIRHWEKKHPTKGNYGENI